MNISQGLLNSFLYHSIIANSTHSTEYKLFWHVSCKLLENTQHLNNTYIKGKKKF